MFKVGRRLRLLGLSLMLPDAGSEEILPEYRPFFDDLNSEYALFSNPTLKEILRITDDRQAYRRLRDREGNLQEAEIKCRFSALRDTHYQKYRAAIFKSQGYNDKGQLQSLIRHINGHGSWEIYFHDMYRITRDAIYYSMSKLNPQIHAVNKFFIDYFNSRNGIRHEHENIFNFGYTLRCPDLRGTLYACISNNMDTFERSPMFVLFSAPLNLTSFGEAHLPEIISLFAVKMQEYENKKGLTVARDCLRKPGVMSERKLKRVVHSLTRECENDLRRQNQLPNVGEGWIQETILFQKLQTAFPNIKVIHQCSPAWLGSQRLDVWIPSLKIAVEYNGQQHYEAVDFFGGPEGLKKQQELDERKAALCAENDVRLFIVRFDEDMDAAIQKIRNAA